MTAQPQIQRPAAMKLFTDRDGERVIFGRFFDGISSGKQLKRPLLHFYGVGGVGKSTLLKKSVEEWKAAHPKSLLMIAGLDVDSDAWKIDSSVAAFFTQLSAVVSNAGIDASLFNVLRFCLWAKDNPNANCNLKNSPFSDFLSDKIPHGGFLAVVADQVGGFAAGFNPLAALDQILGKWKEVGGQRNFQARFGKHPSDLTPKEIVKLMPEALAEDVRQWLTDHSSAALCITLDGFERIQSDNATRDDIQKLFQEFVARTVSTPRVRIGFVVLGREKLRWREIYDDSSAPQEETWDALTDAHLLGGLSRQDAKRFLDCAGAEIPKVKSILEKHVDAILNATGEGTPDSPCYPYALDLTLDLICRNAEKFDPGTMLGKSHDELEERFLRYLETAELKALQALALAGTFDKPLFCFLVEGHIIQKYAVTDFPEIVGDSRSYVNPDPGFPGGFSIYSHMRDALLKSISRTSDGSSIAREILEQILSFYESHFTIEKFADFTPLLRAYYMQAMELLDYHKTKTKFLSSDFVDGKHSAWHPKPWLALFAKVSTELEKPECHDTLKNLDNLAFLIQGYGDTEGAETIFRKMLEVRERLLGPDHSDILKTLRKLAKVLEKKGAIDEAEPIFRKVLEARERTLGPEHADTFTSFNDLVSLLHCADRYAEAAVLLRSRLKQAVDKGKFDFACSESVKGNNEEAKRLIFEYLRLQPDVTDI